MQKYLSAFILPVLALSAASCSDISFDTEFGEVVMYFSTENAPELLSDPSACAQVRIVNHMAWQDYKCDDGCKKTTLTTAQVVSINNSNFFTVDREEDGNEVVSADTELLESGAERVLNVTLPDDVLARVGAGGRSRVAFGMSIDLNIQGTPVVLADGGIDEMAMPLADTIRLTTESPKAPGEKIRYTCGKIITLDIYSAAYPDWARLKVGQVAVDKKFVPFPDQPYRPMIRK